MKLVVVQVYPQSSHIENFAILELDHSRSSRPAIEMTPAEKEESG